MSECSPEVFQPRRSLRPRKSTAKALDFDAFSSYRSPKKSCRPAYSETSEDSDDDSCDNIQQTDTVSTNSAIAGKDIYSFNKVKKHERLLSTPQKGSRDKPLLPKTPYQFRQKLGKGIKSSMRNLSSDEEPFAESASDYSPSNSSSSDPDEEEDEVNITQSDSDESEHEQPKSQARYETRKSINTKIKSTANTKSAHNYIIKTEEYFSHSNNKVVTSNHTLDKLKTPRLNQDQLQKLLSHMKLSKVHQKAVVKTTENSKENFSKWLCLLHENFNILLYGLGSKKKLLNDFHTEVLCDHPVIVINGFFPSLTLKDILDAIAIDLMGLNENSANVYDTVDAISREIQYMDTHIYIIVHNIEGDMLRNHKSQNVLSRLSAIPKVHLIASIDHINAPLIWDHNKLSQFNFAWFDVTSFLPYMDETSFESSMMVQRTGNLALSSLRNVFLSLTSNSKGIYMIIIKYQLEHNTNQYYQGLLFKDLYAACREAFLVSSDLALRAQLTEFVDHKMVRLKRSADGAEYLVISIANNLLQQFLSEQGQ
ncbi:origin recognition complex subunit 2 [Atheta coriaria]|uniref:origin recognition complex subunit 2 n=1 Tax=Dalotia coriaria TaxID=877792 RepID=UPI0031F3C4AC